MLHSNTLTSFSMFRGFGAGKSIICWKKLSEPTRFLETVLGRKPSRFLRIRFFSSISNASPTMLSSREMMSTLVTKHESVSRR